MAQPALATLNLRELSDIKCMAARKDTNGNILVHSCCSFKNYDDAEKWLLQYTDFPVISVVAFVECTTRDSAAERMYSGLGVLLMQRFLVWMPPNVPNCIIRLVRRQKLERKKIV